MHPAFSFTVLYGPQIAGWILANKEPLAATFDRFGGAVAGSLTGEPKGWIASAAPSSPWTGTNGK